MRIVDIHTHLMPEVEGTALVCIGCGPVPQGVDALFSAGIHPWDVTGCDDGVFRMLEDSIRTPKVVAVGECGFDTLRGPSHDIQEEAFIRQCVLSERYGKPMILHVVRDFESVIRLKKRLNPSQPWLIHGFRGGAEQARQLLGLDLLISFGMNHNPDAVRRVPLDKLFLETDGKTSIAQVVGDVSHILGMTEDELERQVADNVRAFIKIETQTCNLH